VSWWVIVAAMGGAFLLVCLIEWLATRNQFRFEQPAVQPATRAVVEMERVEETDEHDSLGWTAFEEAQEPSDAMTIIGGPSREADAEPAAPDVALAVEAEPGAAPHPEPDPVADEPDLPPAASEPAPDEGKERRRWWRRKAQDEEPAAEATDSSSSVHVLPGAEANAASASEEQTEDPLLVEEPDRRRSERP
jgi:hypothetical protein